MISSAPGEMAAAAIQNAADEKSPGTCQTPPWVTDNGDPALSDSETITITVIDVNAPPTAGDDSYVIAEDSGAVDLNVLVDDSIAPHIGETLTITLCLAIGLITAATKSPVNPTSPTTSRRTVFSLV